MSEKSLAAIVFRSAFRDVHLPNDGNNPLLGYLIESWKKAFPSSVEHECVDFEDWVENAVRLDAVIRRWPELLAILGDDDQATYLDGKAVPDGENIIFVGSWRKVDDLSLYGKTVTNDGVASRYKLVNVYRESVSRAEHYADLATFQLNSNRAITLCGVRGCESDVIDVDLFEHLAAMYRSGHRSAFVKVNLAKYMVKKIALSGETASLARKALYEDDGLSWATVHLEGRNNAFIVQEYVEMNHEYRVIVINHKPVCGAGCIERFTPLNNRARWDIATENVRSDGLAVDSLEIVSEYISLANRYCEEMEKECPGCDGYTLDLAMVKGVPCVIEMNPLLNYGLYAMDYKAIIEAEVQRSIEKGFE